MQMFWGFFAMYTLNQIQQNEMLLTSLLIGSPLSPADYGLDQWFDFKSNLGVNPSRLNAVKLCASET